MVRHLAGRVLARRSALLVVPLLALLIGGGPSASAQGASPLADQSWVRLGGPPGGLGYDIRVRPDNPQIWFVTDAFAGVHLSTDGGLSWVTSDEGIDARAGTSGDTIPVFSLTIDPNDPEIVWAGTQSIRGIYRSVDGGKTWEKRVNGIRDGISIRGLAIEPGNSDVVYAAGELSSWTWAGGNRWGIGFDRTKGAVYKSTDAGLHWRQVWFGDDLARYVLIDPTNVDTLYVSTGIFDREAANSDPATRKPGGVGVLKSTDGGETWREINEGIENLYVGSLAMHPEDPQILLAAAGNVTYNEGNGVYLTEDGGEHWQKVLEGTGFFMAVEFAPGSPVTYYATGGHVPFYRSLDDGKTWERMTPGDRGWRPIGFRVALPIDMQVDPRDSGRVFVNNYGGGNYLSTDGGRTWASASIGYTGAEIWDVTVHPSNPAVVYANGRSGPFMSADGGLSWQGINSDDSSIQDGPQIVMDPVNPLHLLASEAQFGVLLESLDGGQRWRRVMSFDNMPATMQLPTHLQTGFTAIAFAPSSRQVVYGGLSTWKCSTIPRQENCQDPTVYSLMISNDGGTTWSALEASAIQQLSVLGLAVHPADSNIVWLATGSAGVFFTSDGGTTWEKRSNGLTAKTVTSLAMHPGNPDVLYSGSAGQGVFKTVDGGRSWKRSSAGMDANEPIRTILVDPLRPNVLYAGSEFNGVYVSENEGASWRLLNNGLRTRALRSLAISADGESLFAATIGEGILRLSTHEQGYFDSLQPTPTPTVPPSPTPTPDPLAAQILVDGNGADWSNYTVSGSDAAGDQMPGSPDLGEIRALNDSRHFYLSVKLHEEGVTDHYDILLDTDGGDFDFQLSVWPERNQAVFARFPVVGPMEPIQDVATAQGDVIEVELPLSALGNQSVRRLFVQTYLGAEGVGDQASDLSAATLSQATATPAAVGQPTMVSPAPAATQPGGQAPTEVAGSSGGGLCGGAAALPLGLLGLIWLKRRK